MKTALFDSSMLGRLPVYSWHKTRHWILAFCSILIALASQAQNADLVFATTTSNSIYSTDTDGATYNSVKQLSATGSYVIGALVEGSNGLLYGVTGASAHYGRGGMIYCMQPDGSGYQVLKSFAATDTLTPNGGLLLGSDGFFYGVAAKTPTSPIEYSSEYKLGYLYKISKDGTTFTILKTFTGPEGSGPIGRLIQGKDGFLYGNTLYGGTNDKGTIFKIKPDGSSFSILWSYAAQELVAWDTSPVCGLVLGSDGFLYGMVKEFSLHGTEGNVFKIATDGSAYRKLASMNVKYFSQMDGPMGHPVGRLVEGKDGFFYGATEITWDSNIDEGTNGTIFKLRGDGSDFTIIKGFDQTGGDPKSSLVQGSDGFFYGIMAPNINDDNGGIFKINGDGSQFSIIDYSNSTIGELLLLPLINPCTASGTILREYWANVPGNTTASIPLNTPPTLAEQLTNFSTAANYGDNYGQRIRGYICAPKTGYYQLFIQGDDQAELYLSTEDNPVNKQKIATASNASNWVKAAEEPYLEAGKRYYVEALHKEGSGTDVLRIGWILPLMPANAVPEIIPGSVLSPYQNLTQTPTALSASASANNIGLSWKDVQLETGYVVERATTATGPFSQLGDVGAASSAGVSYTDVTAVAGVTYYYRVYATSAQGATGYSNVASARVPLTPCTASGSIYREVWTNIPGKLVSGIPVDTPPSLTGQLANFNTPAGYGDNYGQRIRGYICVPVTGSYTFFLQGDDQVELYLSSNDNPVNKVKILAVQGALSWVGQPTPVSLLAGRRYYVEALHKENTGGDFVRVGWRTPAMASNATPVIIPGSVLSPYQNPIQTPTELTAIDYPVYREINVSWNDVAQETGYVIEWATAPTGPFAQFRMGPSSSSRVHFSDQGATPGITYYYRVYAINDQGASAYSNMASAMLPLPVCSASGSISREVWTNVPGKLVSDIPLNTTPNLTSQLTSFRTAAGYGDNYGQRIRGYLCAPATGSYQFFMQGDDKAELYLSSDDDPTHKQKIASVGNSWSWTQRAEQQSAPISLVAGKRYYVEVLHKEATGTDVLRIGWRVPGMASGSEPVIIPGSVLSPFVPPSANAAARYTEERPETSPSMLNAYPNPTTGVTTVEFTAEETSWLSVQLYNLQGQPLQQLFQQEVEVGSAHRQQLDATSLPAGLYLLRLVNGKHTAIHKLVITR